jgi:hypothetical protein
MRLMQLLVLSGVTLSPAFVAGSLQSDWRFAETSHFDIAFASPPSRPIWRRPALANLNSIGSSSGSSGHVTERRK